MCVCVCIFEQHFFIYTYLIKYYRHFLSTIFCVYLFKLPYLFYDIQWELVNKPSIINWFPNIFCLTLGHHLGCVYRKRDVTFACTLQLCKNERFCLYIYIYIYIYIFFFSSYNMWKHVRYPSLVNHQPGW